MRVIVITLVAGFQSLGFDPVQLKFKIVRQRAVHQRFLQRLVRILILDILADNADCHRVLWVVDTVHNVFPFGEIAVFRFHSQVLQNQCIHTFIREHEWNFIHRSHVLGRDHGLFLHVAEESNLRLQLLRQEPVGTAEQNIGLNSDAEQFLH